MAYKQYYNRSHYHSHPCPKCKRIISGTGDSLCHFCAQDNEPTSKQRKAGYNRQLDEADAREFKRQQKGG